MAILKANANAVVVQPNVAVIEGQSCMVGLVCGIDHLVDRSIPPDVVVIRVPLPSKKLECGLRIRTAIVMNDNERYRRITTFSGREGTINDLRRLAPQKGGEKHR